MMNKIMFSGSHRIGCGLWYGHVSCRIMQLLDRRKLCKELQSFSRCRLSSESWSEKPVEHIRNFSIIAHVDHGKSTLADRFLEITGAITKSTENKQVLDRLPVEKERGITVKAVAASLEYDHDGVAYQLNLIDTPGHVDFSNEVSRSLSACQGVILLIDANSGVQAQTVANFYLAFAKELVVIPVLNKIDLKQANPEKVEAELESLFDIHPSTVSRVSAKTGLGVENLLKSIIEKVPPPKVDRDRPFKALVVDAWYDAYRGSILFVYVLSGSVKVGTHVTSHKTGKNYEIKSVALLRPQEVPTRILHAGQVGVVSCSMKDFKDAHVGDTVFAKGTNPGDVEVLEPAKPKVWAGLYPRNQAEYVDLKKAIEKLLLNDSSVSASTDTSPALGYGWRLGFLGLLHLDVFRQRLEQEFGTEVILTAPSVTYKLKIRGAKSIKELGEEILVKNPVQFPEKRIVEEMFEPVILATIIAPAAYYGPIADECLSRRGIEQSSVFLGGDRIMLKFLLPLNEIVLDFHDALKSITSGYASYDYEERGYASATLQKITVTLNDKEVEELTTIVHSSRSHDAARKMVAKLKEIIPRQQVLVTIRAVVDGKILAREDLKPYRKDITAKLHGGDMTRKQKLARAQNEGKKKMRQYANIQIPRDTFIDVLRQK